MVLSYDNLWRLLEKYSMKKTDLMSLTGMSSRTLSKLTKNKSVSLETIMKICEVLHCRVEDVMTISEAQAPVSLYDAYRHQSVPESDHENVTVSAVSYLGTDYRIYVTKKAANKLTVIKCVNDTVTWTQRPSNWKLSGQSYWAEEPIFSVRPELRKNTVTLFVVDGTPGGIDGLDDGIFRSARHPGGARYLHVMSMTAFKAFLPPEQ